MALFDGFTKDFVTARRAPIFRTMDEIFVEKKFRKNTVEKTEFFKELKIKMQF